MAPYKLSYYYYYLLHTVYNIQQSATQDSNDTTHTDCHADSSNNQV